MVFYGNQWKNAKNIKKLTIFLQIHFFIFKNEGDSPLIINNVVPSCGCVTPSWTKQPIAPGDTGSVHVFYKSNMSGTFSKTIKVYSNSQGKRPVLKISGETKKRK